VRMDHGPALVRGPQLRVSHVHARGRRYEDVVRVRRPGPRYRSVVQHHPARRLKRGEEDRGGLLALRAGLAVGGLRVRRPGVDGHPERG
jgi:hypothetical protein